MKKCIINMLARVPSVQYRKSFANDFLDRRLDPFIGRRGGFFVEAGANDGLQQSNTLYFEKYFGWSGILIEPVPGLAAACRVNRPKITVEEYALGAQDSVEPLLITVAGLMSTTEHAFEGVDGYSSELHLQRAQQFGVKKGTEAEVVECRVRSLSSILDSHGSPEIDLLSLDIEGFEKEALAGLDLSRHRPRFILVEERYGGGFEQELQPFYRKEAILSFSEYYCDVLYRRI